jgi:hypothetical protein
MSLLNSAVVELAANTLAIIWLFSQTRMMPANTIRTGLGIKGGRRSSFAGSFLFPASNE